MDLDTGFEIGGDGVDLRIGNADRDPSSSRLMILPLLKIILIENAANAKNATSNLVETEATELETYATGYLVNCNKVKVL